MHLHAVHRESVLAAETKTLARPNQFKGAGKKSAIVTGVKGGTGLIYRLMAITIR